MMDYMEIIFNKKKKPIYNYKENLKIKWNNEN